MLGMAAVAAAACGTTLELFGPGGGVGQGTGGQGGEGGGGGTLAPAGRADILLVLDNSRSMADKQQILGLAVPSLVSSLANPSCLDEHGVPAKTQPSSPKAACPAKTTRQFAPVEDIHIGVISTSLGGHGADACDTKSSPSNDDKAHLLSRVLEGSKPVKTWNDLGFLVWDPKKQHHPPGDDDTDTLIKKLQEMVLGVGQLGCGYEAQLESWYRFLIEPDPYEKIAIEKDTAVLDGTDTALLAQRKSFLRPDSAVAVIILSDENDCSIRDGSQYYFAAQLFQPGGGQAYHLPRPRAACAKDPNDPCCRSCGQKPGEGCDTTGDKCESTLDMLQDQVNLRCFDQKRRFGIDFLYPIDRYTTGLGAAQVPNRKGDLVPNPLFTDLDPKDDLKATRDPGLVFLAGIIGVPWQDIARRDATGQPDLISGRNGAGAPVGGFQSAAELAENETWEIVLGDPVHYHTDKKALPLDALMIESIEPRQGVNPLTGDLLQPPGSPTMANPINGHEYSTPDRDDLQYACIFELPEPRDCSKPDQAGCDCGSPKNDNPLCQDESGKFGQTQFRAKAYPAIRELGLLKELGPRGAVGSICPAQLGSQGEPDFGYAPAMRSLVDTLASRLKPAP
ncbi:MAG: hypothetical protein HY744_27535 [Deltaproteobacteria bacterium]|nr:hypothetical protein [Deltaproteobacteria bacterium]